MRVLILGAGGISEGIAEALPEDEVQQVSKEVCDVAYLPDVRRLVDESWDWVINCAGIDGVNPREIIETNLLGAINVANVAGLVNRPSIHLASVAGLYGKPDHMAYSASKAGVISVVQSLGFEQQIWAISPGRVDTPMREERYPDDTPGSRLRPVQVGNVVRDIMAGLYESGTNIVIRKVGLDNVVVTEDRGEPWKKILRVGQPKTI